MENADEFKTDAMGIWSTEWAPRLFLEAMKFWFYSISFSITLNLVLLCSSLLKLTNPLNEDGISGGESPKEVNAEAKRKGLLHWDLMKKLAIDCCDIFIPGFTTGWLAVSSATVGMLGMVSTLLASIDIWERVQGPSQ